MWLQSSWFESQTHEPKNVTLWICISWTPLIAGPIFAAWGTYFATPTRYQTAFGAGSLTWWQRFFAHAVTINCLGLLSPIVILIAVGVPGIVANAGYMRALRRQEAWQTTFAQENDFSQAMVQEAQAVWYDLLKSTRIFASVFVVWTIFAFFMFIAYSVISWRLISAVRGELGKSKDPEKPLGMIVTTYVLSEADQEKGDSHGARGGQDVEQNAVELARMSKRAMPVSFSAMAADMDRKDGHADNASSNVACLTVSDGRRDSKAAGRREQTEGNDSLSPMAEIKSEPFIEMTETTRNQAGPEDDGLDDMNGTSSVRMADATMSGRRSQHAPLSGMGRSFVPNIVPQKVPRDSAVLNAPRQSQVKELQKAFIHILIQSFTIGPAIVIFMAMALLVALTVHGSIEQASKGGTLWEFYYPLIIIIVNWTTVFFGGVNLLAIAQRTYEPVLNTMQFSVATFIGNHQQDGQSSAHGSASASSKRKRIDHGKRRETGKKKKSAQSVRQIVSTFFETNTRPAQYESATSRLSRHSRLGSTEDVSQQAEQHTRRSGPHLSAVHDKASSGTLNQTSLLHDAGVKVEEKREVEEVDTTPDSLHVGPTRATPLRARFEHEHAETASWAETDSGEEYFSGGTGRIGRTNGYRK